MNTMNLIVVLESSIVIYAVHMADVAHERMNSCHVITHVIMIAEHIFTTTTFVNLTAVGRAESSFSQSWQGMILLASALGDTAREATELDVRFFSGVVRAGCDGLCFILFCCLSSISEAGL